MKGDYKLSSAEANEGCSEEVVKSHYLGNQYKRG